MALGHSVFEHDVTGGGGQVCIGPEFYPDPSTGVLRIKGPGTVEWPVISGAQSVYITNNGLMYDPEGGLYSAPHGNWRYFHAWTGSNLLTPVVDGTPWLNPSLPPYSVTNPSAAAPLSMFWWLTSTVTMNISPGHAAYHLMELSTAGPLTDGGTVGSFINPAGSGSSANSYVMPWTDCREMFGGITIPPAATISFYPMQMVAVSNLAGASAAGVVMETFRMELTVEAILVDANQIGGYP